ncbi:MAG: tetratricopeptide repeat protein [Planctomycetes bacterium]|nr:tetratricopeptide repeat protein [Planctomycetota bacterium]
MTRRSRSRVSHQPATVTPAGGASRWLELAGGLLLGLAVLLAFWPSLGGGFLWDDEHWIAVTPTTPTLRLIHEDDGLRGIWFSNQTQDYWPLSNSMFWLEWRCWGMNPLGYRGVNLALHVLGAILVWQVLRQLGVPWAWLAAALFAVHPVTVASVAWIAELKNCLSLPLAAAAALVWLRFDAGGSRVWYAAAVCTFLLALTAKTSTVVLPVLLLAFCWWRRGRIERQDLLRTAPFFVLAVVMGLVTLLRQSSAGGVPGDSVPEGLLSRLAASGWVAWFYLSKALVPVRLAMLYPRWVVDPAVLTAWLPLAAWLIIWAVIPRLDARWSRPLTLGLGCYLVALGPVLGILPMWFRRYALVSDHLQYLALPAITALVAAALHSISAHRRTIAMGLAAAVLLCCMALTWQRSGAFTSTLRLMQDSLAKNPESWTAHTNLAAELSALGRPQEAIVHYREALRLRPTSFEARNNLATLLLQFGQPEEAIEQYRAAVGINPDVPGIHFNLGVALGMLGRPDEAAVEFKEVLRLTPDSGAAHHNLGYILAFQGRLAEAVDHYEQALRLNPADPQARANLDRVRAQMRQADAPASPSPSPATQP